LQVVNPNPVLNFETWLSSVTERINQEMHYQFDGNPPTMVFHIHKVSKILIIKINNIIIKKIVDSSGWEIEIYDLIFTLILNCC